MFGYERAGEPFAGRFEPDGNNWLFRSSLTSPPIRVSTQERDEAIRDFKRHYYWLLGLVVGGIFAAIAVLVIVDVSVGRETRDWEMWAVLVPSIGVFFFAWFWVWRAPDRQFARRAPMGAAMEKVDARRVALGRLSYSQLAFAAAVPWWLAVNDLTDPSASGLKRWGWATFAAILTVVALVQAFRKWRLGSRSD